MKFTHLALACSVFIAAIFAIAASSIGLQCQSQSFQKSDTNTNFLISNLIIAIITILVAGYFMWISLKTTDITAHIPGTN
jgi:uncharacterized membrane protein AbrB (regulator of aidB expression)